MELLFSFLLSTARKFGLDDVPSDVVSLVSHAAQERLKTLVEKLGVIAAHRMENFKVKNFDNKGCILTY